MRILNVDNERDLKLLLRSFESKWGKALSVGDEKTKAQALIELRFEASRLMDNFERLQQKENGNNFIYRRLLNKTKRWARAMERRLK